MSNEPKILEVSVRDINCGKGVVIIKPTNVYECTLGDDVFIGPFVEIQKGAVVGARTRVQSHAFICDKVVIGDDCFISHGAMFINDLCRCGTFSRDPKDWFQTVLGNKVIIGTNCTILPVNICSDVVIGAGSVATKDITEPGVYVGNPAKKLDNKRKREQADLASEEAEEALKRRPYETAKDLLKATWADAKETERKGKELLTNMEL
jgi:acetyltransferase-like isoleucine patch superfamily enzyme